MLTSIDLFSGIGGMALGLRNVARPSIYCEIDPSCQEVLRRRMKAGDLTLARIAENVRELVPERQVDLVTAGFPCQDISCSSTTATGVEGARSGLVSHVLRIARQSHARFIFLENSPFILTRGLHVLLKLLADHGFREVRWCILSASHVGAPHMRKRWFCVAKHSKANWRDAPEAHLPKVSWTGEPYARILPKRDTAVSKVRACRCAMLGNAAVPQCVAFAWNSLIRNDQSAVAYTKQPTSSFRHLDVNGFLKNRWATPTATYWQVYATVGSRAAHNLPNQIMYDKGTLQKAGHKHGHKLRQLFDVNPGFVEWLMGYPQGWTGS